MGTGRNRDCGNTTALMLSPELAYITAFAHFPTLLRSRTFPAPSCFAVLSLFPCALSRFPVLCCAFLCSFALSCALLRFPALCCAFLHSVALSCTLLRFPALCCAFLHSVALSCALSR